jgi:deaminated glutathione amidase
MRSGPDVAANLAEAAEWITAAATAGAKLIALPENFALMGASDINRRKVAEEDGQGRIQEFLVQTAQRHGVWLVGGTIPLRAADKKVWATCLLYNDRGERVARYDKMHLFDVRLSNGERYQESYSIEPGNSVVVADTPFGRVGLAVCYDLRFPELFRRMLDRRVEIYVVPSAFTAHTGRAHWEVLVRARAIENLAFLVAPDQGGRHPDGRETHGDSMIVSPWGEVLARRAVGAGVVTADCDLAQLRAVREQLPSIEHRKIRN